MILVQHRVNTIEELEKTPFHYGVEIDLRSNLEEIYLSHDPFIEGENFNSWLKYYRHKFLILNVKEEGLEIEIHKILKKRDITNFFFLDSSFPSLVKNNHLLQKKICARYSEFESSNTIINLAPIIHWVWIDSFLGNPLDLKTYAKFQSLGIKICLASPELSRGNFNEILEFQKKFAHDKIVLDAVCSKRIHLWEEYWRKTS